MCPLRRGHARSVHRGHVAPALQARRKDVFQRPRGGLVKALHADAGCHETVRSTERSSAQDLVLAAGQHGGCGDGEASQKDRRFDQREASGLARKPSARVLFRCTRRPWIQPVPPCRDLKYPFPYTEMMKMNELYLCADRNTDVPTWMSTKRRRDNCLRNPLYSTSPQNEFQPIGFRCNPHDWSNELHQITANCTYVVRAQSTNKSNRNCAPELSGRPRSREAAPTGFRSSSRPVEASTPAG